MAKAKLSVLLELGLDACLLLAFLAQGFIAGCLLTYGSLPLPTGWLNRQISERTPGFRIEAEAYRLSLRGSLTIANLRVFSHSIRQPLLETESAVIELDRPGGTSWLPRLHDIVVTEGRLYIPAVYSPDGTRKQLLERISLRFRPSAESFQVENFAALHQDLSLRGSIYWPRPEAEPESADKPPPPEVDLNRIYDLIATGLREKSRFDAFVRPTLKFSIRSEADDSLGILAILSSRQLKHPQVEGEDFYLRTQFHYNEQGLLGDGPIRFSAKTLRDRQERFMASNISGQLDEPDWLGIFHGELPQVSLAARSLSAYGISLDAPSLTLDLSGHPEVSLHGTTSGLKGGASLEGVLDVDQKRGFLIADGSVDLRSLLPEETAAKLPPLSFSETPDYRLAIRFSDGFEVEAVDLHAQVNDLAVDELQFDHLRAELHYRDGIVDAPEIYIERGGDWVQLGYRLDWADRRYGLSIRGSADPTAYSPILPRWWDGIFRDFDFSEAHHGYGDFIIQGRTDAPVPDLFFGHAEAQDVRFRDVLLEQGSLIVRGRERYAEVHQLEAHNQSGWVRGDIRFSSLADEVRGPAAVRFDVEAQLPLEASKKLFGGNIADIIDDFEMEQLPEAELQAAFFNSAYPQFVGKSFFNLAVDSRGPVRYRFVPFDQLKLEIKGRNDRIHLREIDFDYADGRGQAEADLQLNGDEPPDLRFRLALDDADQAEALHNLPQLDNVKAQLESSEDLDPQRDERENIRLGLRLHAEGPLEDLYGYHGYGDFEMRGENLGNIDLLGPFSRALAMLRIHFTRFTLNEMQGTFALKEQLVDFSRIEVDGPRTRVSGHGTLTLPDQALDMRISVFLFANTSVSQSTIRKVGSTLNPIPNLLEFELSGTLADQKWRSLYDPRNLIPGALNPGSFLPEQLNPGNLIP